MLRRFLFHALPNSAPTGLVVLAAMRGATTRRCGMGGTMRCAATRCRRMGAVATRCRRPTTAIGCISASAVSANADVPSSPTAAEAMLTPAVAVAPVRPWSHAQENTVIEIARPIKAAGCAAVRCIVVIAVGTDGLNTYADDHLRTSRWHQCQRREQSCRTGQKQTAHCEPVSPRGHVFELPHFIILRTFRVRSKVILPVSASRP
jgi:hypothetical protein